MRKSRHQTSFVCQALNGDYAFTDEDRLTQVFAAAFNASSKFRAYFFDFAKMVAVPGAAAKTQRSYATASICRPDICIQAGKRVCAVVENKVEADLTLSQLRSYSRIKELAKASKIAMVRHFFEPFSAAREWQILHWSDFYRALEERAAHIDTAGVDHFIISNFLSFLEANGMKTPTRITKSELQLLAKGLHQIRNADKPYFSLRKPFFEIANSYVEMLEAIVSMSREERDIRKRIGKNYQFNPHVDWWYDTDEEPKRRRVSIITEIRWKRKVNGLRAVGTGLFFSNQRPESYQILTYAQGEGIVFRKRDRYKANDLVLDRYAKHVIFCWTKWLK